MTVSLSPAAVLMVEDVDSKFDDVSACVRGAIELDIELCRATHLNEAEDQVMSRRWDLLILDLSMDITSVASIDLHSGHATLGGLDVLERIALLKIDLPTILVTGFDSFQDPDRFENAIMNLRDVDEMGRRLLSKNYWGCVRYGLEGWELQLRNALRDWAKK